MITDPNNKPSFLSTLPGFNPSHFVMRPDLPSAGAAMRAGYSPPGAPPSGHRWSWDPESKSFFLSPMNESGGLIGSIGDALIHNPVSGAVYRGIGSPTFQRMGELGVEGGLAYGAGGAFGALGSGGSAFNPAYAGAGGAGGAAGAAGAMAPYASAGSLPASSSAGTAATFDPFDAAAGGTGFGSATPFAAGGAMTPAAGTAATPGFDWKSALFKTGAGLLTDKLFGGATPSESRLSDLAGAGFNDPRVQALLPFILQDPNIGPLLQSGMSGIADLLRNPGSLSPTVSSSIAPRLAEESQNIAQNYQGIGANQAGALARSNAPTSLKGALASALDVAQERAQRSARNEALTSSDVLRRQDLGQTFNLLNSLLQFTSAGRGQSIQGLGIASQDEARRQAAEMALWSSILNSISRNQTGA